jgi:outer membrane receptor protein involved in Fe transport
MSRSSPLRSLLIAGASVAAFTAVSSPVLAQSASVGAARASVDQPVIEELVVTAQRREEGLQAVPVAVSAFSASALQAQRVDGGFNLVQQVPNVNFSRGNFSGYNFSIRGIGTKVIGGSGESGVSIHENGTAFTSNQFLNAEFYDVDRVEVLRGPQGTLYGRNATGGAVNIITTKPTEDFGGYLTGEYGNYDTKRAQGAINIPLNDMMAIRWAGFYLKRDGFGANLGTGNDVDDRNITSSRLSFRVRPNDALDVTAMWEHYNEKDHRNRAGKQLCIQDPGLSNVGGVPVPASLQGLLSQGCLPGSRYSPAALGVPNTAAQLGGLLANLSGLAAGNLNAGRMQDPDFRTMESAADPIYQGNQNFFQIDAKLRIGDHLTLASLTGVNYNDGYSYQDFNRSIPTRNFTPTGALAALFPGGFVNDPQVGRANTLRQFDMGTLDSKEFTQEVRLFSDFGGKWNFSAGAIHIKYQSTTDYYVFSNGLTAYAQLQDALAGQPNVFPFYVDPNFPPSAGEGHNYIDSRAHNIITSDAAFGEVYFAPADDWKVTLGLRYTRDEKNNDYYPITLLAAPTRVAAPPGSGVTANPAFNGGRGYPTPTRLNFKDNELTGRFNVQWTPTLSFTDRTMVYASYSRGYKGGGFNTPCDNSSPGCGLVNPQYDPEMVNAYEIGTKNTLAGGRLVLNLTGFFYDYDGYQISKTVNKSAVNENVAALVKGLELESIWEPVRNLRFNLNAGWLDTKLQKGSSVDPLNRTQGDPNLIVVKASDASNCVVSRAGLMALLTTAPTALPLVCSVGGTAPPLPPALLQAMGLYNYALSPNITTAPVFANNAPGPNTTVNVGQGIAVNLAGDQLPNSPKWTLAFGAQYTLPLSGAWRAILRGDYYRQADSYARVFNTETDMLKGYKNINATLTFANPGLGLDLQLFVKNLTNETPITDFYLNDEAAGLYTNTFTLEPRLYGVSVTKRF